MTINILYIRCVQPWQPSLFALIISQLKDSTILHSLDRHRGDNFSRAFLPISSNRECIWPLRKHIRCAWVLPGTFSIHVQRRIIFWYSEKPAEGQSKEALLHRDASHCNCPPIPPGTSQPFSIVTDADTIAQLCYIVGQPTGSRAFNKNSEFLWLWPNYGMYNHHIYLPLCRVRKEYLPQSITKIYMIIYRLWRSNCPL